MAVRLRKCHRLPATHSQRGRSHRHRRPISVQRWATSITRCPRISCARQHRTAPVGRRHGPRVERGRRLEHRPHVSILERSCRYFGKVAAIAFLLMRSIAVTQTQSLAVWTRSRPRWATTSGRHQILLSSPAPAGRSWKALSGCSTSESPLRISLAEL